MPPKNRVKSYTDPSDVFGADLNRQQDLAVVQQEMSGATVSWTDEGGGEFRLVATLGNGTNLIDTHTEIDGVGDFNWQDRFYKWTLSLYAAAADLPDGANEDQGPLDVFEGTFWSGPGATWPLGGGDCAVEMATNVHLFVQAAAADELTLYNNTGSTIYVVLLLRVTPRKT